MKFKVDENLPIECAELLTAAGHDAVTIVAQGLRGENDPKVADVCVKEGRILVTLDLDFSDIRTYPPKEFPGFVVLRVGRQDKRHVLQVLERIIPLIAREPLERRLWVVEETRLRIRGSEQ